jgi:hypothetical protein
VETGPADKNADKALFKNASKSLKALQEKSRKELRLKRRAEWLRMQQQAQAQ